MSNPNCIKELFIAGTGLVILGLTTFLYSSKNFNVVNKNIKINKVIDGDTITVLDKNSQEYNIRLACIDAPELNQKEGIKAKEEIVNLLEEFDNPNITLNIIATDRYNRLITEVYINELNLNQHLVSVGLAVIYPQYFNCTDKDSYLYHQKLAKDNELNLWSNPDFVMPWLWRRNN